MVFLELGLKGVVGRAGRQEVGMGVRNKDQEMERSAANSHGRVSRRHRPFDLLSLESITGPCWKETMEKMII